MIEYWLTQLCNLSSPHAEVLDDYRRLNLFIEATHELDKLLRPRLNELNGRS